MAQQINLHSPIHAAPRRAFAARTMGLSLVVLAAGLAAIGGWMSVGGAALRRDMQASEKLQANEREQLEAALAARRGAGGTGALEQQRTQLARELESRRALAHELARGRIVEGRSHAAVLRMIASTVPDAVWLDRIRVGDGSLELAGMTLEPQALRPWLARLAEHPLTRDQRLGAVKLERVANATPVGSVAGAGQGADERERWAFVLSSQVPRSKATESVRPEVSKGPATPVAMSAPSSQPGAAR